MIPEFRCPKCGSPYFGRVVDADGPTPIVRCHGDSSAGSRRCDWVGEWPPRETVPGTRISVRLIREKLAAGETADDLLADYPFLTRSQIEACRETP
jgi:hypothetical protein